MGGKTAIAHDSSLQGRSSYHAFLLRVWQDGPDVPWRALIRDAETDEERRFATLEQLFLFLHRKTDGALVPGFDGSVD